MAYSVQNATSVPSTYVPATHNTEWVATATKVTLFFVSCLLGLIATVFLPPAEAIFVCVGLAILFVSTLVFSKSRGTIIVEDQSPKWFQFWHPSFWRTPKYHQTYTPMPTGWQANKAVHSTPHVVPGQGHTASPAPGLFSNWFKPTSSTPHVVPGQGHSGGLFGGSSGKPKASNVLPGQGHSPAASSSFWGSSSTQQTHATPHVVPGQGHSPAASSNFWGSSSTHQTHATPHVVPRQGHALKPSAPSNSATGSHVIPGQGHNR
jgi:hypothetical protein